MNYFFNIIRCVCFDYWEFLMNFLTYFLTTVFDAVQNSSFCFKSPADARIFFSCHEFLITCFYKIYSLDTGSNEVGGFRGYFAKLRRKMSPNNHLTVCWTRFNLKVKDYHSIKGWHPSLFKSLGKSNYHRRSLVLLVQTAKF